VWSSAVFRNQLYFVAGPAGGPWALWTTNGTAEGTVIVKTFRSISEIALASAGGRLFLFADDGEHGMELWTTDGTASGTVLVKDILPGEGDGVVVYYPGRLNGLTAVSSLTPVGSLVFFAATDGVHGVELWRSDGSARGTFMVRDMSPDSASSDPWQMFDAGGFLAFSADDGVHGVEPWVSNGTEAATRILQDISPEAGSSNPRSFTRSGGRVYFAANDGITGAELWTVPFEAIQAIAGRSVRGSRVLPFRP
jgi:ELWxxDGT repeat protein